MADLGPGTMPRGKYPESPAPAGSHALISRTPTLGGMLHANLGLPRPPPSQLSTSPPATTSKTNPTAPPQCPSRAVASRQRRRNAGGMRRLAAEIPDIFIPLSRNDVRNDDDIFDSDVFPAGDSFTGSGVVMRRRAVSGEGVKEFPRNSGGKASPPCGRDSGMTMGGDSFAVGLGPLREHVLTTGVVRHACRHRVTARGVFGLGGFFHTLRRDGTRRFWFGDSFTPAGAP